MWYTASKGVSAVISHSGYLVPDETEYVSAAPLTVVSAGHYRLLKMQGFHTYRLHGRADFQLLYIAGGAVRFTINGETRSATEGQIVLYRPFEEQDYLYRLEEHPDVYWVHFTGSEAESLLTTLGLHSFDTVGVHTRFGVLLENMIRELQFKRPLAEELTASLFRELLVRMARGNKEDERPRVAAVEAAVAEIENRFAEEVTVASLAAEANMEVCWFSRLFRRQMGVSPQQYLMSVRMAKAKELLRTTDCPVGEVARLTGYDNPLYFSRLFCKTWGCPPREYRRKEGVR